MLNCLAVGAGGFIGAVLRYLIGLIPLKTEFPLKTLVINLIGCFVIGIIAELAQNRLADNARLILFLKVGICGGFTTFSSFALETDELINNSRYASAGLYAAASVIFGIAAVYLGQTAVKMIMGK